MSPRRLLITLLTFLAVAATICLSLARTATHPEASAPDAAEVEVVHVLAASSLTQLMPQLARAFEVDHRGVAIDFTFAPSQTLARQIQAGARCDLYIPAAPTMYERIDAVTFDRRPWLTNTLTLIANPSVQQASVETLTNPNRRVVIAVSASPLGAYTRAALDVLGVRTSVEHRSIQALGARSALQRVRAGRADVGVVYHTDALAAGNSVAIITPLALPAGEEIVYEIGASSQVGADFLRWLVDSPRAHRIVEEHGFGRSLAP